MRARVELTGRSNKAVHNTAKASEFADAVLYKLESVRPTSAAVRVGQSVLNALFGLRYQEASIDETLRETVRYALRAEIEEQMSKCKHYDPEIDSVVIVIE